MNHSGKATKAALKLILWTLTLLLVILTAGLVARFIGNFIGIIAGSLVGLWLLFVAFTLYFFRDPTAQVPADEKAVVSPAHGTVDVIDETTEDVFLGGRCKRVSIFLSVFDVHVQKAPVSGQVRYLKHTEGQFLNAMRTDSAQLNENVLIGFDSTSPQGCKVSIRLIAGLIARRIIPWVREGNEVGKGERISLIQFGSRVDVYLPLNAQVQTRLGDKVVGGETIIATLP